MFLEGKAVKHFPFQTEPSSMIRQVVGSLSEVTHDKPSWTKKGAEPTLKENG